MKKLLIVAFALLIFAFVTPTFANANSVEDQLNQSIDEHLNNIDFGQVNQFTDGSFVGDIISKINQILSGEFDDAQSLIDFLLKVLFSEFTRALPTLIGAFAVIVLCSLFTANATFVNQSTQKLVYVVGFIVVVVMIFADLKSIYLRVYSTITDVSQLIDASMPIILTLMVATGNKVSAKVYQPMVALLSGTVIKAISEIVLPLVCFSLVFTIISNLSENIKLNKLSTFVSSSSGWILGIIFMFFTAFMSVEGISAGALDGVSIRAAKFATKNYVPILGGYLAEGLDMVVASATLIKNSFGLVVLLVLIGVVASPILNVLAYKLTLQALCAVLEPICDTKFIKFFGAVGKNLTFLIILMLAVSFMFVITLTLTIYTANG